MRPAELEDLKSRIDAAEAAKNWGESMMLKKEWFGEIMRTTNKDGHRPSDRVEWSARTAARGKTEPEGEE